MTRRRTVRLGAAGALLWAVASLALIPLVGLEATGAGTDLNVWDVALGGELALQVPGNFDAPSHALMRDVAARPPYLRDLDGVLRDGRGQVLHRDDAHVRRQRHVGAGRDRGHALDAGRRVLEVLER